MQPAVGSLPAGSAAFRTHLMLPHGLCVARPSAHLSAWRVASSEVGLLFIRGTKATRVWTDSPSKCQCHLFCQKSLCSDSVAARARLLSQVGVSRPLAFWLCSENDREIIMQSHRVMSEHTTINIAFLYPSFYVHSFQLGVTDLRCVTCKRS